MCREAAMDGAYVLVQHVCTRVPERADYRSRAAQNSAAIVRALPRPTQARLLRWLDKYSHQDRVGYRMFALELACALLHSIPAALSDESADDHAVLSAAHLGKLILPRVSDKAAVVRARALGALATLVQLAPAEAQNVLALCDDAHLPYQGTERTPMRIVRRRTTDERPTVRKAAVLALEAASAVAGYGLQTCNAEMIADRCRDAAVSVRKQAMDTLTNLLQLAAGHAPQMLDVWLDAVLPQIVDDDTSVQQACVALVDCVIVSPIETLGLEEVATSAIPAWRMLGLICRPDRDASRYVEHFCRLAVQQRRSFRRILARLAARLGANAHEEGAWMLTTQIVMCDPAAVSDRVRCSAPWFPQPPPYLRPLIF